MANKVNKEDYIYLTAYLRAKMGGLLNRERAERMINAKSLKEALRVLEECGYTDIGEDLSKLDSAIERKRAYLMSDIASSAPNREILDIFRLKYDYHNAKVLIKSEAMNKDERQLLSGAGRYDIDTFVREYRKDASTIFSPILAGAIESARDTLAKTGDSRLCDFILDEAYYNELSAMAEKTGSAFIEGYAKLLIDSANLRVTVRALRMGKDGAFLKKVLFDGGNVRADIIADKAQREKCAAIFSGTKLEAAAQLGDAAVSGGSMTEFEKKCDDTVSSYIGGTMLISYGPEILVSFLTAAENEFSAVRIILLGKASGTSDDVIRARLREFI